MKLGRVTDNRVHQALQDLAGQAMPPKTAYKLKTMLARVREEHSKYEDLRKASLERYGNRTEDGALELDAKGNVKFSDDNVKGFVEDLNSLMEIEFDLEPLKLDDLGNKILICARDLDSLDGFIVE